MTDEPKEWFGSFVDKFIKCRFDCQEAKQGILTGGGGSTTENHILKIERR
jgi:hypothetical protein